MIKFILDKYRNFRQCQIAKLAYQRYENRGRLLGFDKEDWHFSERCWFLKYAMHLIKENMVVFVSVFTMIILISQIVIESSNFTSLNRPFVEVKIIGMMPDPQGRGEDSTQVWCNLIYEIENYGPVPAYNVRIAQKGLRIWSKVRGEFNETAIPGLREFIIGWLAPNARVTFPRAIIYTDAKTSTEAYNAGRTPLEIEFKILYDGPKGLLFRRQYWYLCRAQYQRGAAQVLNTYGN